MTTDGDSGQSLGAEIGMRVRHYRNKAGLSGVKLAAAAGVSQPFLSQLESGQSSVAIATLYRIARALGIHPSDLLPAPGPAEVEVVRAEEMRRAPTSEHVRTAIARASFGAGGRILALSDYEIAADDHVAEWYSSEGEHALYVLEGSLRLEFKGRSEVLLEEGDAAFYNSRQLHRWYSGKKARVVLVVAEA